MCVKILVFVFRLKPGEIQFLKDYAQVMKPMAQALNILQGECNHSNAYMGYLAPTIALLKEKLQKKNGIATVKPLVTALLDGIDKRFDYLFDDEKIIAAALLHPKFKDNWTNDEDMLKKGIDSFGYLTQSIRVQTLFEKNVVE
jgi:hypothetical protein